MALDFTELDLTVAASPGASIDSDLLSEIKTNMQFLNAGAGETGTGTFAGLTGDEITITAQADTTYHVDVTPKSATGGNLGDVYVVINSTTKFTVYNTGSHTGAFSWRVSR